MRKDPQLGKKQHIQVDQPWSCPKRKAMENACVLIKQSATQKKRRRAAASTGLWTPCSSAEDCLERRLSVPQLFNLSEAGALATKPVARLHVHHSCIMDCYKHSPGDYKKDNQHKYKKYKTVS